MAAKDASSIVAAANQGRARSERPRARCTSAKSGARGLRSTPTRTAFSGSARPPKPWWTISARGKPTIAETASGRIAASDEDVGRNISKNPARAAGQGGGSRTRLRPGIRAARMMDSKAHQIHVPDHRPKNPAREAKRSAVKESKAMARDQQAAWGG